jgi:hypothetical protein
MKSAIPKQLKKSIQLICLNAQSRTTLWETLASMHRGELRFGKPLPQSTKENYALGNPCLNAQSRTTLWETLTSVNKEELCFGKPLA